MIIWFSIIPLAVRAATPSSLAAKNIEELQKVDSLQKLNRINKVPKQYSFEFGYRHVFSIIDHYNVLQGNAVRHGYGYLFDYAWQLSGLNKTKPAVYISLPMGFSTIKATHAASNDMTLFAYGWSTRHELGIDKKFTPFVGYGLLLNTLKIKGSSGGIMGHQTQFDAGFNIKTTEKLTYFTKIQYSYTSFPIINLDKRIHLHFADLRIGIRF